MTIDAIRVDIPIKRLSNASGLGLPEHATPASAGVDLLAAVGETVVLAPGGRAVIPSGIAVALPIGFEAQIRPRSGLAAKNGVTVLNAPGTIDADYRGEIGVVLVNLGQEPFAVERGMRIAQMVVARVARLAVRAVEALDDTDRGDGGFGSTGGAGVGGRAG